MNSMNEYREMMPVPVPSMAKTNRLIDIEESIGIAQAKGMEGQVTTLKRKHEGMALATMAESKNMACLRSSSFFVDGRIWYLYRFHPDGVEEGVRLNSNGNHPTWRYGPLSTFEGNIPSKIIRDIPKEIIDKALVFRLKIDPIIALPIKPVFPNKSIQPRFWQKDIVPFTKCDWLWLGIYQWD